VLTSNTTKCAMYQAESQNVKSRWECVCEEGDCDGNSQLPNNEDACTGKGGVWTEVAAHGLPAPLCRAGAFSRDNHLGNAATDGSDPIMMNWTIPAWAAEQGLVEGQNSKRCVLRLRYNMSSNDEENTPVVADSKLNALEKVTPKGTGTPIFDRNNNEEESYKEMLGFTDIEQKLGFATNTNQYGRTFQDRTYTFEIKPAAAMNNAEGASWGNCKDGNLYNMNVRGKRGNIVQAYPSVEYDFVPNKLTVTEDDCIHLQWTGSDYNPNRNPNNGEGGPPNPNNSNEGKSDRTNMVQTGLLRNNFPVLDKSEFSMFTATSEQWLKMTFLDQPLTANGNGPRTCLTATELDNQGVNNRQDRERDHRNCGKLSGAKIPHTDIGVVKAGSVGTYEYMSTRNNNLSNRGQKGTITVTEGTAGSGVGTAGVVGIVGASFLAVAAAAYGGKKMVERKNAASGAASGKSKYLPQRQAAAAGAAAGSFAPRAETKMVANSPGSSGTVIAKHPYSAQETGELSFKKGEMITVLRKDNSGWWEGKSPSGQVGVFPSNYVS